jgi:hypothetical protein
VPWCLDCRSSVANVIMLLSDNRPDNHSIRTPPALSARRG